MALATRCPNCHALFRVVADQLKLRGGLVRCGACQHVFDAIGTLSYVDDTVLATSAPPGSAVADAAPGAEFPTPASPGTAVAETIAAADRSFAPDAPTVSESPAPMAEAGAGVSDASLDGAAASTQADETGGIGPLDRLAEAQAAGEEAAPSRTDEDATTTEEAGAPAFLRDSAPPKRRRFSIVFGGGSVVLALLGLAQLAAVFRSDILAGAPSSRPLLTQVCRAFGCTVDWPARGDLLAVVSSELQSLPGTAAFELTAVVRNRGSLTLALPAIELTLTDTLNRAVARRVFLPQEYLAREPDPAAHLLAGLEPGADLTVRIAFELRGPSAAGFVVYPFYL